MSIETLIAILVAVAIAALSVWAVEFLAEQRSRRDRQLDAIDQTVRQMIAVMGDASASLAGPGADKPGRFDADAYPSADQRLVGDIDALREFYSVLAELHSRAPGSGIRESDLRKAASANQRVRAALAGQEERVLTRRPIRTLTSAEMVEYGAMMRGVTEAIRQTALADEALQRGG
jgi:hypothetical protein